MQIVELKSFELGGKNYRQDDFYRLMTTELPNEGGTLVAVSVEEGNVCLIFQVSKAGDLEVPHSVTNLVVNVFNSRLAVTVNYLFHKGLIVLRDGDSKAPSDIEDLMVAGRTVMCEYFYRTRDDLDGYEIVMRADQGRLEDRVVLEINHGTGVITLKNDPPCFVDVEMNFSVNINQDRLESTTVEKITHSYPGGRNGSKYFREISKRDSKAAQRASRRSR